MLKLTSEEREAIWKARRAQVNHTKNVLLSRYSAAMACHYSSNAFSAAIEGIRTEVRSFERALNQFEEDMAQLKEVTHGVALS